MGNFGLLHTSMGARSTSGPTERNTLKDMDDGAGRPAQILKPET